MPQHSGSDDEDTPISGYPLNSDEEDQITTLYDDTDRYHNEIWKDVLKFWAYHILWIHSRLSTTRTSDTTFFKLSFCLSVLLCIVVKRWNIGLWCLSKAAFSVSTLSHPNCPNCWVELGKSICCGCGRDNNSVSFSCHVHFFWCSQ